MGEEIDAGRGQAEPIEGAVVKPGRRRLKCPPALETPWPWRSHQQPRRKCESVPPSREAILPPALPAGRLRRQYRPEGWGSAIGNTDSFWGRE